jgi:hypothetical protein
MTDVVALDTMPGDKPLMSVDERFTQLIKDSIERDVTAGHTPESAALRAGISVATFRNWTKKHDNFADWVEGLKVTQCGELRFKTITILAQLEEDNPSKAAELYMRFLSSVDEEFGVQKTKTENKHELTVAPPIGYQERQADILEKSEARVESSEIPSV